RESVSDALHETRYGIRTEVARDKPDLITISLRELLAAFPNAEAESLERVELPREMILCGAALGHCVDDDAYYLVEIILIKELLRTHEERLNVDGELIEYPSGHCDRLCLPAGIVG